MSAARMGIKTESKIKRAICPPSAVCVCVEDDESEDDEGIFVKCSSLSG